MDEGNVFIQGLTVSDLIDKIRDLIREEISNSDEQDSDVLIGSEEVCEILGISKATLWNYVRQGRINKYGLGRRVYYKKEEVVNSVRKIG